MYLILFQNYYKDVVNYKKKISENNQELLHIYILIKNIIH